jgi:hypothetical protein
MAQSTASTTFDFPQPLGPTIVVIPSGKLRWRRSTKDLNPITTKDLSFIRSSPMTKSNHQIPSSKQIPITNIQTTQTSFDLFFSKILIIGISVII